MLLTFVLAMDPFEGSVPSSSSTCGGGVEGSDPLQPRWLQTLVARRPPQQQHLKQRVALGSGLSVTQSAVSKVVRRGAALLALFLGMATWRSFAAGRSVPIASVLPAPPELAFSEDVIAAQSPRRLGCACGVLNESRQTEDIGMMLCSPASLTRSATYNSICAGGSVCLKDDQRWQLVLYFLGVFYMFIALAIVCDEFFVPSLEYFCDEYDISADIAGATFMAAGGSMPELFTSFIGTFKGSSVGIAAIVGSAVFNVLFVIATCAVASQHALVLTWWPLFRDCCYYMFTLVTLALFFSGPWSKDKIEWWEALILLVEYFGYCLFMKFNGRIYKMLSPASTTKVHPEAKLEEGEEELDENANANFLQPSKFRTSIVQLLIQNEHICDIVGMAAVVKVAGSLKETFNTIDKDGSGDIDVSELQQLLASMGLNPDSKSVEIAMKTINRNDKGKIGFEEFKKWYMASEARVEIKMRRIFQKFDRDGSGFIEHEELVLMLQSLGHKPSAEDVRQAMELMSSPANCEETGEGDVRVSDVDGPCATNMVNGEDVNEDICTDVIAKKTDVKCDKIGFPEFSRWYLDSLFWQDQQRQQQKEAEASEAFDIDMPKNATWQQLVLYVVTYPLCAAMYVTMPDVRRKNTQSVTIAFAEFLLSLCWIAIFSISLVEWTEVISNTFGVPIPVAGVTILAAGTSIPDLLSSYIVAKQGKGDMAVSSSIGSNIFDVTVGLPLPWLAWSAWNDGKFVGVDAQGVGFFISLLVLMILLIVMTIKICDWKMTKGLGYTMFAFYFGFIIMFLLVQMPEGDPVLAVPF